MWWLCILTSVSGILLFIYTYYVFLKSPYKEIDLFSNGFILLHIFSNLKSFPFEGSFLSIKQKKVGWFKARQLRSVNNVCLTMMKFAQLCLCAPSACTCRRDCVEQTCRFPPFPDLYEKSDGLICLNVQMIDHQF
jgi:hypothetical protein